tara:strand:+ start:13156 stop:14238 length:1083 start_codon:yes stop_codon:yes gene_type:complete
MMRAFITGGAGFIGSALVRRLVADGYTVLNFDLLTYAGDLRSVADVSDRPAYNFIQGDVADDTIVGKALTAFQPDVVFHLAAESHVDRSIDGPDAFIRTNLTGTSVMLQAARAWHDTLKGTKRDTFRFIHVSTDEVYGTLGFDDPAFTEDTPYAPNSPYAASKAGADHLARAWHETFGLPVVITNCSNNYGPYQHPEKLIPTVIRKALTGEPIPVYGKGENIRDWLFVEDHVAGLLAAAAVGTPGQKYNFGGNAERRNIDLVHRLCSQLDEARPRPDGQPYARQIAHVTDRPGHDLRYAVNADRSRDSLGWTPQTSFEEGMARTVHWYLSNGDWLTRDPSELDRLGLGGAAATQSNGANA